MRAVGSERSIVRVERNREPRAGALGAAWASASLILALALAGLAFAAEPYQKLVPSDYTPGSFIEFGASLAIEGDTLVVGDPSATFEGAATGAVYVFERRRGSWAETAKLGPPSVTHSIDFGRDLALRGDRLVVGAAFSDTGAPGAGSVYVFERGAGRWSWSATLVADTPVAAEGLGLAVALLGNTIAASTSPQAFPAFRDSRVYVFGRDPRSKRWRQSSVLVDPGGGNPFELPHSFGSSMVFAGAELAIPASFGLEEPRVVYLRKRAPSGSWRKAGKLVTPAPGAVGRTSDQPVWLGATADRIVAGAPADFHGTGAAYVFDRGAAGFSLAATLTVSLDPRPNSAPSFAAAVAAAGDRVAATAIEDDRGWGAVYLWERGGSRWKQRAKLTVRDDQLPHGQLGRAIALDDRTLAVSTTIGLPWEVPRPAGGAVYLYDLDGVAR